MTGPRFALAPLASLALLLACSGGEGKDGLTRATEACDAACTDPAQGGSSAYVGGMLCGAAWTCRCALPGEPEASVCNPVVRVGIISDTNLTAEPVLAYAAEAAGQMASWSPHLLAHAGNLIPDRQPDPAGELEALLAAYRLPGVPRLLTLGYSDVYPGLPSMDTLRNAYPADVAWLEPGQLYGSMDLRGVHFVVLDQTYQELEPATHTGLDTGTWNYSGYIPQAQRDWLVADLAATKLPAVIFVHAGTGISDPGGWAPYELGNAAEMRSIFEANRNKIAAVIGGYVRNFWGRVNGVNYLVVGGVAPHVPITTHDRGGHAQLELDTEQRRLNYTVWENDSGKGYLEVQRVELPY